MKIKLQFAAMSACIGFSTLVLGAETLSIGIDKSGSNPLLTNENFAYSAAQYVTSEILELQPNDVVNVKTFGARDDAANIITNSFTISRRVSPQKVADVLTQYIRAIPSNSDSAQNSTNLIAYLEFTSGLNCESGGKVVVITDGLESSSLVSGAAMLEGQAELPDPQVDLTGCEVTFYGLGAGWAPQSVRFVRGQWISWFEQSGADFKAIIP